MIFEKEKIKELLNDFYDLYKKKPIQNNDFGMKSPQMFGLFCYLKLYQPSLVIESGVYKGQGTWLIKSVLPSCELICIEPNYNHIEYRDPNSTYFTTDLNSLDLSEKINKYNEDEILVFFDDHQNFSRRFNYLIQNKLHNILFEDNYPSKIGDCISPKQIMEDSDKLDLKKFIEYYEEFPPIYEPTITGWGESSKNYSYLEALCQNPDDFPIFWDEKNNYYWISYIKIKK